MIRNRVRGLKRHFDCIRMLLPITNPPTHWMGMDCRWNNSHGTPALFINHTPTRHSLLINVSLGTNLIIYCCDSASVIYYDEFVFSCSTPPFVPCRGLLCRGGLLLPLCPVPKQWQTKASQCPWIKGCRVLLSIDAHSGWERNCGSAPEISDEWRGRDLLVSSSGNLMGKLSFWLRLNFCNKSSVPFDFSFDTINKEPQTVILLFLERWFLLIYASKCICVTSSVTG